MHKITSPGKAVGEVIFMKYANLNALLKADPRAREYFNSLPDYVRQQMASNPGGINSMDSLQTYANNLTQGDD